MGTILSKFQMIEMTKIWKAILSLSTENETILKATVDSHNSLNWLTMTVNFLCETIQNIIAVNVVQNNDTSEMNLKIIAFFVKLLIKFTEMYRGKYFRGHRKFVQCLLYLNR